MNRLTFGLLDVSQEAHVQAAEVGFIGEFVTTMQRLMGVLKFSLVRLSFAAASVGAMVFSQKERLLQSLSGSSQDNVCFALQNSLMQQMAS
jgi:hypothetical protein